MGAPALMPKQNGRLSVSEILPPKPSQNMKRSTVEMPRWVWDRLKQISQETRGRPGGGYTRDEVAYHFLNWAIQEWDAEAKEKKGKK